MPPVAESVLATRGPLLLAWFFCAIGGLIGLAAMDAWHVALALLLLHALGRR